MYPCAHTRSQNCPHYLDGICPDSHVVPFSGPEDSPLIVVGEAPGATENQKGVPFIGDSGQELDRLYLPQSGMARKDVAVANAIGCLPPGRPSAELIRHCSQHVLLPWLEQRLEERERVVVCLGTISAEVVGGEDHPEPGVVGAVPGGWLLCAPHPAAAMRSASRAGRIMDEILLTFRVARALLQNPEEVIRSQWTYDRRLCADVGSLIRWLGEEPVVAMDTETMGFASRIYCSSFAAGSRSAVLMADNTSWPALIDWLSKRRVVMHNALYDVEAVASAAGPDAADRLLASVEDTMLLAYEIRGLPLGLKPLAALLCGYNMQTYEATFLPHFRAVLSARLKALADRWRESVDAFPCCTLTGGLFSEPGVDLVVSGALRPRRGETPEDYRQRLKGLEDEVLAPLAGRRIEALQGGEGYKFSCILLEEVDSRFAWTAAVDTAVSCAMVADRCRSLKELQAVLATARRNRHLAPDLPSSVHSLMSVIDQSVLVEYAAQDAEATLSVWRKLNSILEVES